MSELKEILEKVQDYEELLYPQVIQQFNQANLKIDYHFIQLIKLKYF